MNGIQQTVIYEQAMDLKFLDEVYHIPGGEKIKDCIQCGTCSGSCPVTWAMEETPRQIFAMIRAGMRDKVLDSLTIWTCASCYQCMHRCPQEIKITDIMYMLKRMAMRENRQRSKKASALAKIFYELVNKKGRNHETWLTIKFMLSTNPFGSIAKAPLGYNLFTHGRFPLVGKGVRDIEGLRKIVAKAKELGGE
jgi:quinone-modifying oxidoreductase, subunit QmoC